MKTVKQIYPRIYDICEFKKQDTPICSLASNPEYTASLNTSPRTQPCSGEHYQGCAHWMRKKGKT